MALPALSRSNAVAPTMGAPAPGGGGLFGQPAPAGGAGGGLFGKPAAAGGTGGPTSLFGGVSGSTPQGAGGLFGVQPTTTATVSPFGATAAPAQPAGLFGQPAKPPQPAAMGNLFGVPQPQQPAGVSLFGQPQQPQKPAQTGLFGQPQQPGAQPSLFGAPTAMAQPGFGALPPNPVVQAFGPGCIGGFGAPQQPQFITFLEAATRAQPLRELRSSELVLPLSNPLNKKTMGQLPGEEQTYQSALQIDQTLSQQEKDLSEIDKAMKELQTEASSLRSTISDTMSQSQAQCHRVSQIKLQIEAMEADLRKNFVYHQQLDEIVDAFNDEGRDIAVPFQFFYDLYQEQERQVAKLSQKVQQAEGLAEKLLQETLGRRRDAAQGTLVDSDLDQVSLRDKIFQVCTMLYSQQNKAGLQLAQLESRVSGVRKQFTSMVLKKHSWETQDSINQLFAKSQGLEMNRHLSELSKRQFVMTLSKDFEEGIKLFCGKSDKQKTLSKLQDSNASKNKQPTGRLSLTERLHRGTQASIKMGRRQGGHLGLALGDHPSRREEQDEIDLYTARLGKRTHLHVHEFGEETLRAPAYSARQRTAESAGFSDALTMRRSRKEQQHFYAPQSMLYRQPTTDKQRLGCYSGSDGFHSFATSASSVRRSSNLGSVSFVQDAGERSMLHRTARNPLF